MQTECLVRGSGAAELEVHVRFLQLVERSVEAVEPDADKDCAPPRFRYVKDLAVDGQAFYSWQEAVERELDIPATDPATLGDHPVVAPISPSGVSD